MSAQANGDAMRDDLEDAAERIACGLGVIDELYHFRLTRLVRAVQRRADGDGGDLFPSSPKRYDLDMTELDNVALDLDVECCEQLFCDRSARDTCRCLTSRRS